MPGGRPREHDREKIAQDLIEWARLETSLNLNKFCCTREPPIAPSKITQWSSECSEFRKAYETAKAFLGARREEMLSSGTLHVKAYDLNATTYDHFLKEERKEMLKYEIEAKKDNMAQITTEDKSRFDEFIQTFRSLQKKD